jgi:tRNA(Ile)-lysidine synthetase-like protein
MTMPSPNPLKQQTVTATAQALFASLDEASQQLLQQFIDGLKLGGVAHRGRSPRLVVAYSGGVDSTALLQLSALFRDAYGATLVAVYVDHGWRGKPAPELPRLQKNCMRLRVPLVIVPPNIAVKQSEEGARVHRYEKLLAVAQQFKADAVLTGHHQGDQIETLLFRLFRGTGIEGLSGIQSHIQFASYHSTIPVVRPLLTVQQPALAQFCTTYELQTFSDPTNANPQYARNAIRHQIVPVLESVMPQFRQALLRLSDVCTTDAEILTLVDEQQWQQLLLSSATKTYHQVGDTFNLSYFCQLSLAYQRRLMCKFLNAIQVEPSYRLVQQLIAFLTASPTKKRPLQLLSLGVVASNTDKLVGLDTIARQFLVRSATAFWIEVLQPTQEQSPKLQEVVVAPVTGGLVTLPWDEAKGVRMMPWPKRAGLYDVRQLASPKSLEVSVNIQAYQGQALVVRTRRTGDWIAPLGMGGKRMKLKDYFIQQGIAQPLRSTWTLVVVEATNEVLWVPEVGLSHALQVAPKKPPTHSWMIGAMSELEQLKTLKFLFEDLTNATEVDTPVGDEEDASATVAVTQEMGDTLLLGLDEEPLLPLVDDDDDKPVGSESVTLSPQQIRAAELAMEAQARAFLEEVDEQEQRTFDAEDLAYGMPPRTKAKLQPRFSVTEAVEPIVTTPTGVLPFVERRKNPNRYGLLDETMFERAEEEEKPFTGAIPDNTVQYSPEEDTQHDV